MRKTAIALLVLGIFAATSALAANQVRISQVYGGGGNTSAYYRYDYVELFNSLDQPVNISGWAILYAASGSTSFGGASNAYVQFPTGSVIPACGYYLIQNASGANTSAAALPVTPDAIGTIAMSATACKIGLVTSGTSGTCTTTFVDLVAAGTGSTGCWEGTGPTATMSNANAAVRKVAGMTDTDNNAADFSVVVCNQTLAIHSSASGVNVDCNPLPTLPSTWGSIKTLYR